MAKSVELGLPEKMEIHYYDEYIHLVRKWFSWKILIVYPFFLIFSLTFFRVFTDLRIREDYSTGAVLLLYILFVIAVGTAYNALAGSINKTNIYVSKDAIKIEHVPLPWVGNKRINVSEIEQLYSKEKISRGENGLNVNYEIYIIMKNGVNIRLLAGLETSEQALFIEQEIEKYFGIEGIKVDGEIE